MWSRPHLVGRSAGLNCRLPLLQAALSQLLGTFCCCWSGYGLTVQSWCEVWREALQTWAEFHNRQESRVKQGSVRQNSPRMTEKLQRLRTQETG